MLSVTGPLVETEWLATKLEDPTLRIFDCTVGWNPKQSPVSAPAHFVSGREDWRKGHIRNSGFVDLLEELTGEDHTRFVFPVPPPERFDAIVPCGLEDVEMVSMASVLARPVSFDAVADRVALEMRKAFP